MKRPDINDPKVRFLIFGIIAAIAILIGAAIYILSNEADGKEAAADTGIELPNPETEAVDGSKVRELESKGQSRRNAMVDELFSDAEPMPDDEDDLESVILGSGETRADGRPEASHASPYDRNAAMVAYLRGDSGASGDNAGDGDVQATAPASSMPMMSAEDRKAEHQRRVDAMMSSMEGATADAPATEPVPEPVPEPAQLESAATQPRVRRSTGVSTFDDDWGTGVTTFEDDDEWVDTSEGHVFKVMFTAEQKIRSGQKVTLRLLEDMVVNGMLIPANTHLYAICTVGERLNLTVTSIEVNGRIYALNYTAYDTDGFEGLYCPETNSTSAGRQAVQQGTALGSSTVSARIARSAANQAAALGATIIQGLQSETSVRIMPGYTFYLVKKN